MGTKTIDDRWICWHRMDRQWLSRRLKFQRLTTRQHALGLNGSSKSRAHNRLVPGSNPGGPTDVSPAMPWTSAPLNQRLRAFEPSAGTTGGQTERDFRLEPSLSGPQPEPRAVRT